MINQAFLLGFLAFLAFTAFFGTLHLTCQIFYFQILNHFKVGGIKKILLAQFKNVLY